MNEIKFRAWDKKRKEMLPVTMMDWRGWWVTCEPVMVDPVYPLEFGERNSFKNMETDRHVLMRYIGLKDRHKKDIYEGDIVLVHYGKCCTDKPGLIRQGTVIYNSKMAAFNIAIKDSAVKIGFWGVIKLEVIGNIYESEKII